MRKIKWIMLIVPVLVIAWVLPVSAAPHTELYFVINSSTYTLDGERRISDAPVFLEDGQPMVPLRIIAEAFGLGIEWDDATRSVLITSTGGNAYVIDAPLIVNNRTFVPLAFVVEVIGAETNWVASMNSFYLAFSGNISSFNSRYIRTMYRHEWFGMEIAPVVVASADELNRFIETYHGAFPPGVTFDLGMDYPDDFFDENFLVIISIQENSGSISHRVESVNENGQILVTRFMPMIGTADMAQWLIVVELCNSFMTESFSVEFISV